jgi:hypothetical protein
MKHLYEAIAKRSTGKYNLMDGWGTKEQIVSFLEKHGYTRIVTQENYEIQYTSAAMKKPIYSVGDYTSDPMTHWIKFCDPIKAPYKLFFCRESDILDKVKRYGGIASLYSVVSNGKWERIGSLEKFREIVKKELGI